MWVAASISASLRGAEGGNARTALAQVLADNLPREFRMDHGKLEMEVLLASDLAYDVDHPRKPRIRS